MRKIKFFPSYEHSECGLACAAMLIEFFRKRISLTMLREKYGVPTGGFSIAQILSIMEENELSARALKVKKFHDLKDINEPFIAYWNNNHYVVVEKFKKNKVVIVDPARGRVKISLEEFENNFSNIIICSSSEANKQKKEKWKFDKNLLYIIKSNRKPLILTLIFTFVIQLLMLFIPMYIKKIVDSYSSFGNYSEMIFVLILIMMFYFSFSVIKVRVITFFQNNFDRMLMSKTISHLVELPMKFFINRGKGELIFTINSNQYIRSILSTQMISLFIDIVFLVLYLILMINYSWKLSIVTLVLGVILVGISIIDTKILIGKNQTQMTNITDVQNITSEIVNNISTIKAVGAEGEIFGNWSEKFEKQLKLEKEKARIDSVLGNIPATIQISYSLIIFVLGMLIGKNDGLTLGTIVAFNTLGAAFLAPMLSIANSYLQLSAAKIYIKQLLDIINSKVENEEESLDVEIKDGSIDVKNLSFKYDYFSRNVLNNVDIDIKSGEKVALVGTSGSGKTTLLMVLAGLYQATEGEISVGNERIDCKNLNKRFYRKQLGIVLQESMLFNGEIRENILMGREADDEQIMKAVYQSDLEQFVNRYAAGLDTIISEDGGNISGGQRQRLCIARAVLNNPKIILMDEPTSSLDNISESRIMSNLFEMDSTVIVVAHRLASISKFDKIIVMEQGQVVSIGTHEELLEKSEHYKELYAKK